MNYIIYAAYGSNLLEERFIVYIKGGTYEGRYYGGCIDKANPVNMGWMYVPHRLYFAKKSSRWGNKGVAFISCEVEENKDYHSVVKLWKIKEAQFKEIWEQEGEEWYHKKLELGRKDDLKIFTITGCWENERNQPSEKYLNIIKKGLIETTGWSERESDEYLKKRK